VSIRPSGSGKTASFIAGQLPASPFCQRWNERRHSWRHTSEGGFNSRAFEVAALDEPTASAFVVQHHYSGSYTAALQRYGLYSGERLVGVAVLTNGSFPGVLSLPFPKLVPMKESAELGRLVLLDEVPANAESWFIAEAFRQAAALGMRGIVSFSDPLPRTAADGTPVMPGHVGTIYQASNAQYAGRATDRTIYLLPNGQVYNEQCLGKVRLQKQGHQYAEQLLVDWGAKPKGPRQDPKVWLHQALAEAGCRRVRHPGNHRYLFTLGDRRARRSVSVTIPAKLTQSGSYPKTVDSAPVVSLRRGRRSATRSK